MIQFSAQTYSYHNVLFDVSSSFCELIADLRVSSSRFQLKLLKIVYKLFRFHIPKWIWLARGQWRTLKRSTFHSIKLDVCIHVYTAITLISLDTLKCKEISYPPYDIMCISCCCCCCWNPIFINPLILTFVRSINNQLWKFYMSENASNSLSLLLVVIMNGTRNLFTDMKILLFFSSCCC